MVIRSAMRVGWLRFSVMLCLTGMWLASASAANWLTPGPVSLKSIGPMTFTPDGTLLIGDPKAATIYAMEIESAASDAAASDIADLTAAIGKQLSAGSAVELGELAVHPKSKAAFVTATVDGKVQLLRVSGDKISEVNLDKINHASKQLASAPADKELSRRGRKYNLRNQSITDLAYFDGKLIVSGLAAGASPSQVLEMPVPFAENSIATGVEIFHAAHGRDETATIRTFLPMKIDGKPTLLAGFTCTPLVRFDLGELDGSQRVRGTTVAELGNRNTPLDMVVYQKEGATFILMSNTARGIMKISTAGIQEREGLTERVSGGGTAGQTFETIDALAGVVQMDQLDGSHAVVLQKTDQGLALKTIELP